LPRSRTEWFVFPARTFETGHKHRSRSPQKCYFLDSESRPAQRDSSGTTGNERLPFLAASMPNNTGASVHSMLIPYKKVPVKGKSIYCIAWYYKPHIYGFQQNSSFPNPFISQMSLAGKGHVSYLRLWELGRDRNDSEPVVTRAREGEDRDWKSLLQRGDWIATGDCSFSDIE